MAKQIIWSLRAQQDKKEILQYWKIHNQSANYSRKLNGLFRKAINIISKHPSIGRKTDIENVRVKLVKDYSIFYEESSTHLIILIIWDNRRNPEDLQVK